jgi:hypothetical protein
MSTREQVLNEQKKPGPVPRLPPAYVTLPVSIGYAAVDDGLIVTMVRILGLCWRGDRRCTPPLTRAELGELTGRPKTTLWRHLRRLERELGWLRVEREGRHLVLYPRVEVAPGSQTSGPAEPQEVDGALWRALQAAGVENPARDQIACDGVLDPAWVRAWHLWTQHPDRENLTNPAGLMVRRLQYRERPPQQYLQLAALTEQEMAELRAC